MEHKNVHSLNVIIIIIKVGVYLCARAEHHYKLTNKMIGSEIYSNTIDDISFKTALEMIHCRVATVIYVEKRPATIPSCHFHVLTKHRTLHHYLTGEAFCTMQAGKY